MTQTPIDRLANMMGGDPRCIVEQDNGPGWAQRAPRDSPGPLV
jgi:hypothetical protein